MRRLFAGLCVFVVGCAAAAPPNAVALPSATATPFPEDAGPLPRYRSKRLALSLPLPDGAHWRIDDRSRPELVATHAATSSRVAIAVFRTTELVGRSQCERLARDRKLVLVPLPADRGELRTLEDDVSITQQTFDTRIWVAVEPGAGPGAPLVGHVIAFGGFLRKCYVFVFSSTVMGVSEEPVLSSRLAYARARILGGLELDPFASISREAPVGPELAPQ